MTITTRQPDPEAVTHGSGRSPGWFHRHPLLGYTRVAYGISWTLLIGGFFASQAGVPNPDGSLIGEGQEQQAARWGRHE